MHHVGKLETCPFRDPLLTNKKSKREHLLQNNHKHGSRPKYFNNNIYTSISGLPKYTIACHRPKVTSVNF